MQKVLFIGNYSDSTGWSYYAQQQILALDAAGLDVVCRCIRLNNNNDTPPERIIELEQKRFQGGADIIVENVLPHYSEYSGRFSKNIINYMSETSGFFSSTWANHINLMDYAWVPSEHNRVASLDSGVTIPIKVVPVAADLAKYERSYPVLSLKEQFKDKFIFYTIGEFTKRKNIETILRAFHLEFDKDEPVELMIKTTPTGIPGNPQEYIERTLNEIKRGLKLSQNLEDYKSEIIICQNIPAKDMPSVHKTGDVFISASHGEGWCLPAFDAMGFGRPIIVPNHTGFKEYATDENAWLVPAHEDCVHGAHDTFNDLCTGKETWKNITVPDLRKSMREAYENKAMYEKKVAAGINRVYDFSYEKVGQIMREALSAN